MSLGLVVFSNITYLIIYLFIYSFIINDVILIAFRIILSTCCIITEQLALLVCSDLSKYMQHNYAHINVLPHYYEHG